MNEKKYFVLNPIGVPIMREGDEANPYIFYDLRSAFKFAEKERQIKEKDYSGAISIVEINIIEQLPEE